ncbi:MAG: hypothetical protein HC820_03230 [Hydrococcus sp. RM1_1_31]|nr:hypothetical protein [Hydrococcus sp. RM1_1_31]
MQRLLQQKLYTVASLLHQPSKKISNSNEWLLDFTASDITLYRLKSQIGYRCAIALQLARQQGLSSLSIAEQLLSGLITVCPDFTILVEESGWIEFRPSDRALAIWLQQISQQINFQRKELLKEIVPNFFNLQYTHARCCSLLRLGHREGIIQLNETLQWKQPYPIPWLDKDNKFRLIHPAEIYLIGEIMEVIDVLDREKVDWIKLTNQFSEAVLECDRDCQFLGEVKRNYPELSQAKLGLYAIAQLLLQKLLEEKIKVWAPVEL